MRVASLPRPGFRGKLALAIVLVVAVTLGIAFFAVYRGTESELRNAAEDDLVVKLNGIEADLKRSDPENPAGYRQEAERITRSQPVEAEAVVIAISLDGFLATNQPQIIPDPDAAIRAEDEEAEEREEAERFLEAPEGFSEQEIEDLGDTLELSRTTSLPGVERAVVRVGKSLKPTEEALEELGGTFLRLGALALAVSALLAWFLATRLTRPLRRLTAFSEDVAGDDLTPRLTMEEAGSDETRALAVSFNRMLDRLEAAFDRQKAFVADASHDLRTPLTIVRGQIEVLARNPNPTRGEVEKVAATVGEAVERMERLVDALLVLARSESTDTREVELLSIRSLFEAERQGRPDSERERIELGAVTEAEVEFDRSALTRALANLVDNALRHSGDEGRVVLSAEASGGGVSIMVDDDGPGIPLADRERIFDRFARLDRARSSDTGGAGLGLAIVKALIESGGGSVSCSDSPLGGSRFSIRLPAEPVSRPA